MMHDPFKTKNTLFDGEGGSTMTAVGWGGGGGAHCFLCKSAADYALI